MTTIGLRPWASAFRVTKVVCGIGPSTASTSSRTESTIESTRSTSPPKSAWPGVSTMFMRQSRHAIAVFFDRMVIPRSRSRSFESMTRSVRSAPCFASVPDCRNSWSTSVVLPWSTWAMIAMLRSALTASVMWARYPRGAAGQAPADRRLLVTDGGCVKGGQGHSQPRYRPAGQPRPARHGTAGDVPGALTRPRKHPCHFERLAGANAALPTPGRRRADYVR